MKKLTLQEACNALAIEPTTLYRWMERAGMEAETDEADKRRRTLTQAQVQQLARAHHKIVHKSVKEEGPDPDAMQQQIDTLQSRIETLERKVERLAESRPITTPAKPRLTTDDTPSYEGPLPDGYAPLTWWCETHNIAETTARRYMRGGEIKKGKWEQPDGSLVKTAIDPSIQRRLWEIFSHKTRFTPCPNCPHMLS